VIKYIFVLNYYAWMNYKIKKFDPNSKARTGQFFTERGVINTPIFMPVGTAGTVKAIHQRELLHDIEAEIILGNTYHLYLRPGIEVLSKAQRTGKLTNPVLHSATTLTVQNTASPQK
jgi:tRNA-guanine family transglycosylase